MVDKSLQFGQQNFMFVASDEAGPTYYYYGYQNRKGTVWIMRLTVAGDAALYYAEAGAFSTIWSAKASHTYVTPVEIKDPRVAE